jgi:heterodisulfide reductase subunit B2
MKYAYYPGCSLTGSARKLDKGVRTIFAKLGHELSEIPEWNCCGAFEYGDRRELVEMSKTNLRKAAPVAGSEEVVAPCPACYKNLKEASVDTVHSVRHPLEILGSEPISPSLVRRDLKGHIFTPYYGCILMRPEATAITDKQVMERIITGLGGEIEGEKVKARCCGGNQFFINRRSTERLSSMVLEGSRGTIVLFCPLCHMALTSFSRGRRIIYFTDLLLYVTGERNRL